VRGDRGRLKQVIVNLLDNAIRFTPRGGAVVVRTARDKLYSILEVHDTGIGIPTAALPHVFERFYRVDEARSREDGGGGLGLSIAKSICAAHGAQIEVESEVGNGSCFRLVFPRPGTATGPRASARTSRSKSAARHEPRMFSLAAGTGSSGSGNDAEKASQPTPML
jgi:signal transduction histidine kinase